MTEIMDPNSTEKGREGITEFTDSIDEASLGNMYFIDRPENIKNEGKEYLVRVKIDNLMSQTSEDLKAPSLVI
ncbi:MAG: hypothetical protein IPJ43_02530 [Saprospiraceae bacterium]|nr:hypothetical protein [Saprospiraceae bacterium]